jgi:hypothetical protein
MIASKSGTTTCFILLLLVDSIFKLVTLIYNKHPFIALITKYKSPECHRLMVIDNFIMIALKVSSIFIMLILGIRGVVKGSNGGGLDLWKKFRTAFNIYILLWLLGKKFY